MNEFFPFTRGKEKRGERGAEVTRHWELLRKGELCFINAHSHTALRAPTSPVKQQVSVRCVWWGRITCGYVCKSEGRFLCAAVGGVSVWALSCIVSLLQSLPVVLYRSASRPEGFVLNMDCGQMAHYQKVRLGDRPESGLTRVCVISQACSRCIVARDGRWREDDLTCVLVVIAHGVVTGMVFN